MMLWLILHSDTLTYTLLPTEDALFTYSTRHIPPSGGESVPACHHEESPTCKDPLGARSIRLAVRYPPLGRALALSLACVRLLRTDVEYA